MLCDLLSFCYWLFNTHICMFLLPRIENNMMKEEGNKETEFTQGKEIRIHFPLMFIIHSQFQIPFSSSLHFQIVSNSNGKCNFPMSPNVRLSVWLIYFFTLDFFCISIFLGSNEPKEIPFDCIQHLYKPQCLCLSVSKIPQKAYIHFISWVRTLIFCIQFSFNPKTIIPFDWL